MISKTLGTSSRKFARLQNDFPEVGLFAQALYPLLVVNTDDFGRCQGDAFTIKHSVWSTAPQPEQVFEAALNALVRVGMIHRYESKGEWFVQVVDFDRHQQGLHKRTESRFPNPPETPGDSLLREGNRRELNGKVPGEPSSASNRPERLPKKPEFNEAKPDEALAARAGTLVNRYYELFIKHRNGARLKQTPVLDFQHAMDLVTTWDDDERLEKLAILVLEADVDEFINKSDRSFRIFAMKASWADDRLRQWELEQQAKGRAV